MQDRLTWSLVAELEAWYDRGNVGKVDGAVFEACIAEVFGRVESFLYRDAEDAAASKIALVEVLLGSLLDDEATNTSGIPEQLVERDRDEVRLYLAEVKPLVRAVGGHVE